ncbi:MAG: hypothetical protein ACOCU8_03050, partial [Patescibacteria group bacterium]
MIRKQTILILTIILLSVFGGITALAAPNLQINYQGRLTDGSDTAVTDGDYGMVFRLYTTASGGSPIWEEELTGANEVTVANGLFSVMLGEVESLAGVDFNQTLYLALEVEGDGEMTPRKVLGSVPAAFEARYLDGFSASQFLKSGSTTDDLSEGTTNLYWTLDRF